MWSDLAGVRRRPQVFAFLSAPVDTAPVFAASSIGRNGIGGHYDHGLDEFVFTTEGIIALCEGLKGSSVTSLDLAHSDLCNEAKQALEDAAGSSLRISF